MPTTMVNVIGYSFSYSSQLPLTFRINLIVHHYIVKWYGIMSNYRFSPTMPSQEVLNAARYYKRRMTGKAYSLFLTPIIDT